MNIPQIVMGAYMLFGLLVMAHQHGKPRKGNYSFWATATDVAILSAITYFGGFWV